MKIQDLYQVYQQHPQIQTDTRKLTPDVLFFALKGLNFNANAFAAQALANGAAFAVIDEPKYHTPPQTILVDDVLQTLQALAAHHRQQFKIPILAITGSNGKTTTKELIHAVLSTTFVTYTTAGNLNNHIGVPLTLLKIKPDAEMAIIEMGANHLKEIESYCAIAQPTHGLITNCGKAHLEGFGSEAGIRKGKGELFDYLRAHNGTAFIMNDYDYLQQMSKGVPHIIKYGTAAADIVGQASSSNPFLTVTFSKPHTATVATQLVGSYNLPNVLAAMCVGHFFGVSEAKSVEALQQYQPSNSRSQLVTKGTVQVIVDAYNANPSSMKAAIENFARDGVPQKILVLGAMAEMGADSLAEHKALVNEIEKWPWRAVLLVGGDFEKIKHPFLQMSSAAQAGAWLQNQPLDHTSILLKGSRSMAMEAVLPYIHTN